MRARFGRTTALLAAGTVALVPIVYASPAHAATINVDSTADVIADDGSCTLREAVIAANENAPSGTQGGECPAGSASATDVINVPAGTYTLTLSGDFESGNIESDLTSNNAMIGDLDIFESVNVVGAGARSTVVQGGEGFNDRIFDVPGIVESIDLPPVPSDAVVGISGLTVSNGSAESLGGGIRNVGTLTLTEVAVDGNEAVFDGGGIRNDNVLNVVRSTVSDNTVTGSGEVSDREFGGGGILNNATATITNSTISGNSSGFAGGGVITFGAGARTDFLNATLAANSAPQGSNYAQTIAVGDEGQANATFRNTILADPRGGGRNCSGDPTSAGNNLTSDNSCDFGRPSDIVANPRLGPLANNGGPTDTHALRAGSPAIDEAETGAPATDQRGVRRPQDGDGDGRAVSDIGAFERRADGGEGCTITGTPGNDYLVGTSGDDVICGLGGNDLIVGLGGNDILLGGPGNDELRGGPGDDLLVGGSGNDDLRGAEGNDTLRGESGDDNLRGGGGNDTLIGGSGKDAHFGDAGNDRIDARDGVRANDIANGGDGNDTCRADRLDRRINC